MFRNLTTAQAAVLHLFESLIASIAITVIVGGIQYLSTNGLNIPGLVGVCVSSFLGATALAYKSIKSDPNTNQALLDTVGEIKMAPGILPDLQSLAQQLAPALAQELAKIKLPAPPQPQRQQQAVQQQPQPVYMPNNPNVAAQNLTLSSGSYVQNQQMPPAGQAFDLQSMQTRQMPVPGQQYGQSG